VSTARRKGTLSGVDGFGLSVAALDMLFCALGAIMLIFAMQERAEIERVLTKTNHEAISAMERRTHAIDQANASNPTRWPGVQSLPAFSGAVVLVLDLSGSLANDDQRRAQRHLVTQYVLQNRVTDFGVVYFASESKSLVRLGAWDRNQWVVDMGDAVVAKHEAEVFRRRAAGEARLVAAGIPEVEIERLRKADILTKLAWFDVVTQYKLAQVGSGTRIDDALAEAVEQAKTAPQKPHVVLISDGQMAGGGATPYFSEPKLLDSYFESRVAVSLVNARDGDSFDSGATAMDSFASGIKDRHVLIQGYGIIPPSPEPAEEGEGPAIEPDLPLQGAAP
jgi:hypothetical protein